MPEVKTTHRVLAIVIILGFAGLVPAASAVFDNGDRTAVPCCPQYEDYPDYPYGVDPYYMFPMYCNCPFLDDALARFEKWNIPYSYWEYVINNQNSSCSTCGGSSSTVTTFSYSNAPLIIPEKDTVMSEYDAISISTRVMSKDQAMSKFF